ncbi:hypothetical protein GXM_02445 [Nostoc sphaeroides CCNUC1]|uniref:Uncharacterized protein n=1 Tax=Nostoc sphaeroides CCNUC1 TaxID=2653204 RepID=A0A5P8VX61_9NOSO|nr:hypothetical protein GXM_02445 [Nostoc sphaeroides CCNUC1]
MTVNIFVRLLTTKLINLDSLQHYLLNFWRVISRLFDLQSVVVNNITL